MVHLHCGRLHSITRKHAHRHLLQQWQLFLLNELENLSITTTTRSPVTTTTTTTLRRTFSSCACRESKQQQLETTTLNNVERILEKRNNQRRIPHHISAKFDKHVLPPQSMSSAITIRSHLENGDRTRALEAFEAIAFLPSREHGIPRAIAQQLLACLRAEIRGEGTSHNKNNSKNNNENNNNNKQNNYRQQQQQQQPIRSHYKAKQLQRRYQRQLELLLTHVRSLDYFWDDNEFRVILELFDRMDLVERAEVIFRDREIYCDQPITMFTYNKLAAAYLRRIKAWDYDKREQMRYMDKLDTLIKSATSKHGLKPDVVTFNLLLSARARIMLNYNDVGSSSVSSSRVHRNMGNNHLQAVEALFEEMEKQNVKPNDRTLNIALDIYGKLENNLLLPTKNNMDEMLSTLLKSVGKEGDGPDVITYSTTIRNAILQRDMYTAEKTFRAMVEKGVMPNEFVFSHLVVGYVQLGDMEKAHDVIRLMQTSPFGLHPTVHVFTPVIQGYARSFEYDKAYNIFSEMVDQGIPANLTTYTILATMFVDSPIYGNPAQAIHVLRGLSKMPSLSTSSSLNHVEEEEEGEGILDQAALTLLIEAHGLAGARNLDVTTKNNDNTSQQQQDGESSRKSSTSSFLSRRELHARAARDCYDIILQQYNKPDHLAHTALLTAYARLGLPDKAWEFWQQLKETDTLLTTIHYNALFMGIVNLQDWYPTAKNVFDEMRQQKSTVPDVATYDLLIHGAFEACDLDWIRDLWNLPCRPRLVLYNDNNMNEELQEQEEYHDEEINSLLVRTYYYALYSMMAAEDMNGALDIFKEFKKLPYPPASATIWSHRIYQLAQRFSSQ
ncbi:hypothetical protein INT45_009916 [Circinella minor]|uniref:PROP1-like PPR domain-containing protein n=1 Tax=Circinella minor TaxID=1195481 RepID=A0A8H7VAT2_9FUNG|nr:hypothetical protein INT45_009916 [Circinella minor]